MTSALGVVRRGRAHLGDTTAMATDTTRSPLCDVSPNRVCGGKHGRGGAVSVSVAVPVCFHGANHMLVLWGSPRSRLAASSQADEQEIACV